MVKSYLRYAPEARWGVIVSSGGTVAVDPTGRLALAPALESVHVWSLRQPSPLRTLHPSATTSEVTALDLSADGSRLAVGHADGAIRLWDPHAAAEQVTFSSHASAVSSLRFSSTAALLLSTSLDTHLVLWDAVAEAGLCRLRGHRAAVTDGCHLEAYAALASVAKDGALKLWDTHTQRCVHTAAAPSAELWSVDEARGQLLTGGAAAEVLLWRLEGGAAGGGGTLRAVAVGRVAVACSGARVARLRFGLGGAAVGAMFADRNLQLWGVQGERQLRRQARRRLAKLRRGAAEGRGGDEGDGGEAEEAEEEKAGGAEEAAGLEANDVLQPLCHLRASHKLHSFAFAGGKVSVVDGEPRPKTARLLVAERNNSLKMYSCEMSRGGVAAPTASIEMAGHRNEPRALCLSADDRMALSVADGDAKVWSVRTQQCVRTMPCGYGLCAAFLLASKYAAIGTKAGALQLFCLATGEMVQQLAAHTAAIWSLAVQPAATALLSASADKTVGVWRVREEGSSASLELERSLELGDDVMSAAFTPDGKHIVAAMLDASVRVVFFDSFKPYLTLYGHKLPVLSVSASSDGALVVSGSADKSIKIWGLDFGDCHRSLLGHSDSVMCVKFVRETHYFFSCGKDKMIKYWDADSFEQILSLPGHHAEVWAVVPSRHGDSLLSISRDRSIRLWKRTDEQVFVEEEREAELEQLFEAGLEKHQQTMEAEEEEAEALGLEGGPGEAGTAGRRTIDSVKGAERVLEALKVLEEEDERVREYEAAVVQWEARAGRAGEPPPPRPSLVPNLLLLHLEPAAYLLKALSSVRTADLEQALLLLPFDAVQKLFARLLPLLPSAPHAELMARCILFLLKVHHKAIVANRPMLQLLHDLDASLRARLEREQATIGYNLSGLRFLRSELERHTSTSLFEDSLNARRAQPAATTAELRRRTAARKQRKKKS